MVGTSSLHNDWAELLEEQFQQPYYQELRRFLIEEYNHHTIFPDKRDIFNALHLTSYANAKVVILGQDPYHGSGQAHGLSFSVRPGIPAPPSLQNIFKELQTDLGWAIPQSGCLEKWAERGVLLLNTVLTVREGSPSSHKGCGWENFTDAIISMLNKREKPLVFILWGSHAQGKQSLIDAVRHSVIKSPHPSPLSSYRGFFGSRPFSRANDFLQSSGLGKIDWTL